MQYLDIQVMFQVCTMYRGTKGGEGEKDLKEKKIRVKSARERYWGGESRVVRMARLIIMYNRVPVRRD